jgi:hypothetical protein
VHNKGVFSDGRKRISSITVLVGLVALSLLACRPEQVKAQPSYVYTTFDVPGAMFGTSGSGINDAGQIVGDYIDPVPMHGFLLSDSIYVTIDVPGAFQTIPLGINNAGEIVGTWITTNGLSHGFFATPIAAPVPERDTALLFGISSLGSIGWTCRRSRLPI